MPEDPKIHKIGIILNGVTGRMGKNQHLLRSIVPIIRQGGVQLSPTEFIMPDPLLVGRDSLKLKKLSAETGITKWSTDLEASLIDVRNLIYFDAQTTNLRADGIRRAAAAGKHIYCEKPVTLDLNTAVNLAEICDQSGLINGVVQSKMWLPGIIKLKRLIEMGFFGKIISVRGEFGYWVFEGQSNAPQRPSWNYRKEDGGGMIQDMFSHWRYLLDNIFGKVKSLSCIGATHIPKRINEEGQPYACTADDTAYATFQLENGIIAQFNASWSTRVRRDDLLTLHVDGTKGSAVAGLSDCWIQHYGNTPNAAWNPDTPQPINFYENWSKVPEQETYENPFKAQWELYLKHVLKEEPFPWDLQEGAKGVQLAEIALQSWQERRWLDVPDL
jgi:predicted dehydrogenase